jgi:hypothetical protein
VCSQVLKYANEAILRSVVSSTNIGSDGTKFQNSERHADGRTTARSALLLVSLTGAKSSAYAQLESAEEMGVRAAHLRSRIPAMALT